MTKQDLIELSVSTSAEIRKFARDVEYDKERLKLNLRTLLFIFAGPAAGWRMERVKKKEWGEDTMKKLAMLLMMISFAAVAQAQTAPKVSMSWDVATDNVGVTGYEMERCQGTGCTNFTKIATVTAGTTYIDTAVSYTTTYSWRVLAFDAAGNKGPYSNTVTRTIGAPPDTILPSAPANLTGTVQ